MRIGIINFHFANNYGAVLESVALQKTLQAMGHETVVIDYRPAYMAQQFAVYPSPVEYAKWAYGDYAQAGTLYRGYQMFRRAAQALLKYKNTGVRKRRLQAFERFIHEQMNLSGRYETIQELAENPPVCDAYISGSDQLWNPYVTCGSLDPAYFLQFGGADILRIAYAVSPCQLDVAKYSDTLARYTAEYQAISLRESEKQPQLSALLRREVPVCIDPTLLLQAEDYLPLEEQPADCAEPYILLYGFIDKENPDLLGACAGQIAQLTDCPIIDISHDKIPKSCPAICRPAVSPGEFLYYIHHARYVVTNSFHGTTFSILYRKNFWSIEKTATASRMRELMLRTGLQDRLVASLNMETIQQTLRRNISYEEAVVYLRKQREEALGFLNDALQK